MNIAVNQEIFMNQIQKNFKCFLPKQVIPFPVYPLLQVHVRDPGVFVQVAFVAWQPPLFT